MSEEGMRDPHVESLHYRLVPSETVDFDNAPALQVQQGGFQLSLADGELNVVPAAHFATEAEACAAVNPVLRAWEIHHALSAGSEEIRFEYERSNIIDRNPPPPMPGVRVTGKSAVAIAFSTSGGSGHVSRSSYPSPPADFALDPDVQTLFHRWSGYKAGNESLQQMAYVCLTVLKMHGGLKGAAARFGVSATVLSTLGHLSTETGDMRTALKVTPKLRAITGAERAWLEAAVQALIRRAGEVAADPTAPRPELTKADLPTL